MKNVKQATVSSVFGGVFKDFKRWGCSKHVLFVFALVLYLLFESSFHAILTMTVIDPLSTVEDIHRVEIYGRLISGFGSGLLLTNFISKKLNIDGLLKTGALFSLFFSLVYFGQKAFVERFIIEPSSPEVRRDAVLVNTVKTALYNQDLVSSSVNFSKDTNKDIEPKVMLSLLSAGFLYDDSFKESALKQIDPILNAVAINSYNSVFYNSIKPKFNDSKMRVSDLFESYGDAHRERDKRLTPANVRFEWDRIYDRAAVSYIEKDIKAQIKEAGRSMNSSRVRDWYNKNLKQSLDELIAYRENNGRSTLTRGSAKRFINQAKNPNSKVNQKIQSELSVPKAIFTLWSPKKALPWIQHAIIVNFEKELNSKLARNGIDGMRANIRKFSVFERHRDIQAQAKSTLGEYYFDGFSFNLSDKQLFDAIKGKFVSKEVTRMKNNITSNTDTFKDGGELEKTGKNALRAIVVPCIALVLSVILSVTSVVKLFVMALTSFINSIRRNCSVDSYLRAHKVVAWRVANIFAIVGTIFIVINAPKYIGWHKEVTALLDGDSPILYNFTKALSPLIFKGLNTIEEILPSIVCAFVALSIVLHELKIRSEKKKGLYRASVATNIIATLVVAVAPLYLTLESSSNQHLSNELAENGYAWLLSVQPMVFEQGFVLNEIGSLPNIVDNVTKPLKEVDSNFWRE